MIKGAIVVGDLLRPDGKGQPGGADRPTLWLWNAIKRQIYLATELPSEPLVAAALSAWIEALRPPAAADPFWAGCDRGQRLSDAVAAADQRVTVNSDLAHEAPYFGKIVHALAPLPLRTA